MSRRPRQFASDNYAGICPEAWQALVEANQDHAPSYGQDDWTARAVELIRALFETECEVFFVFNGTAANALALASLCQPHHRILCHQLAHLEADECGAPEFFCRGSKLVLLPGPQGKIEPAQIEEAARRRQDVHHPMARAVSVTQATELGTLYSEAELQGIGAACRRLGLTLHMDGARFANALASTGLAPRRLSWEAGVKVLSLGGSKNGLGLGEAVVFFDRELALEFDYRRKQAGQLASKMRFLAAPWVGMLRDGAWLRLAQHANEMAASLAAQMQTLPGIRVLYPCQANAVFVDMPPDTADALYEKGWMFYPFPGSGGWRFMCAWDTREEDVVELMESFGAVISDQ